MAAYKICLYFVLVSNCLFSASAYHVSEFEYYGSEQVMKELLIPSFETHGSYDHPSQFAYCRATPVSAAVQINDVVEHPVAESSLDGDGGNAIKEIEVFLCSEVASSQLVSCDTPQQISKLCQNAELTNPSSTARSNIWHADAIMLRVIYYTEKIAKVPAVGIIFSEFAYENEKSLVEGPPKGSESFLDNPAWNSIRSNPEPEVKRDGLWQLKWKSGAIGQTSGVSVLDEEFTYVFHRGDRAWGINTFDRHFNVQNKTKINTDTILKCKVETGECGSSFGKNQFLLPHGISVTPDKKHLLVTDVGSHQVLKLNIQSGDVEMTLGTFGEPLQGDDPNYFCQPADAEMDAKSGLIFVADGYCNKRVAVFTGDGKFKTSIKGCFGQEFRVAHDLAIDEANRMLFVADRENDRICVYNISSNSFGKELDVIETGSSVYAVDYNIGNLYSAENKREARKAFGVVMPTVKEGKVTMFSDSNMQDPHDLSAFDNKFIFVSDLKSEAKVFKFIYTK